MKLIKKSDEEGTYDYDIIECTVFFIIKKAICESNDQIIATKTTPYLMKMIKCETTSKDKELSNDCISLLKLFDQN